VTPANAANRLDRPGERGQSSSVPTATAVAATLREIGALLALEPANRFRGRAYERGADAIAALPDLDAVLRAGRLTSVPGIGRGIARTIDEIIHTGRSTVLERLQARHPPGALALSPVLSPARIRAVHDALGVTTLAELRAACEAGRVATVHGFGPATERRLLARIDALAARREGVTLAEAERQGDALLDELRRHPAVARAELAGAFRRRLETIDRLDVVIGADDPTAALEHASATTGVVAATADGPDRAVLVRPGRLAVHLRVVAPSAFAAAWLDATGTPDHVSALSRRASARGLRLDDRGLYQGTWRLPAAHEAEIYQRLELAPVPPELRDDGALEPAPPDLLSLDDVQGAVHCHTLDSDGKHGIETMARAADALGFRYLTITDHSPSATYANGLDVDRLRRQWDEIARVQERVAVRLLRGAESDILRDGALDLPDAVLRQLDVVIASIHNRYGMDATAMTKRLVRAMRHPVFKIWGHALGRYVLSRPPFACRMETVLDAIADARAAIEVNGDPHRLDLAPRWIHEARRRGIRFVVSSDAHSTAALRNVRWGVAMARRGRLRRADVLNTLGPDAFAAAVRP
jgi:DNA polymerase (family 10)